jgi:hypothetical protein
MSVRIGVGFRPFRHVWIGASVPLFRHARRLADHRGHGSDLGNMLLGLFGMWVIVRFMWALATGG